jgi:serine/threonine protein kinase
VFASDIFAVGCVFAELFMGRPLFPGSSEEDQIHTIFKVLGTPKSDQWREGYKLAEKRQIIFTDYAKQNLQKVIPNISSYAVDTLKCMLKISAQKRFSAA